MSSCIDKLHGWKTAWGKLAHFSEDDFRNSGFGIVSRDLQDFSSRDSFVGAEINGSGTEAKQARKLLGECWAVSISKPSEMMLEFQAMLDIGKGRGVGKPENRFNFPLPSTPEAFFSALNEAFDKCCVVEDK
jgi:hypothetical protein